MKCSLSYLVWCLTNEERQLPAVGWYETQWEQKEKNKNNTPKFEYVTFLSGQQIPELSIK